jgi:iron complex transport system substrate-binding protein
MTRRQAAAVLAVAALAACSRKAGSSNGGAPARSGEARRIVSVSPSTTEALFAIGAGDRVVGRSRYCDWPPEAAKLPVVGGVVDVDLEAVVQLAPDLVVGTPGPASARLAEKLASFDVATWFPGIESLAAVDALILGLGERTGHASGARAVVDRIAAQTAAVERALTGEAPTRALTVVDVSPVVAAGPGDFLDEMVRRAGGINALASGAPWQTLDFEQIAGLDPEVVLDVSYANGGGASRITPAMPGWSDVRAVREGRVVTLDDERVLRPGPRVGEGLALVARALHPHAPVPSW